MSYRTNSALAEITRMLFSDSSEDKLAQIDKLRNVLTLVRQRLALKRFWPINCRSDLHLVTEDGATIKLITCP